MRKYGRNIETMRRNNCEKTDHSRFLEAGKRMVSYFINEPMNKRLHREAHTARVWVRIYVSERFSAQKHTSLSYHTSQPHKR